MKVEYVDHMGTDLTVVNAARVSFSKESGWDYSHAQGEAPEKVLKVADEKLIRYLATHNHWTPFSHATIQLRMKTPIFVARQLFKHKVGMTENEISRRYVDDDPEFFYPDVWRGRPTDGAKQGSSGEANDVSLIYDNFVRFARKTYHGMLENGVAPEQARMVLPQSMYTEWYWTGSLSSYARIYNLRSDPHAQMETQEVAKMIDSIIRPLYPVSWKVLTGG